MQGLGMRSRGIQAALPNLLTGARLALTAFFLPLLNTFLVLGREAYLALIIFACICLTDYFDGKLARKLRAATRAGAVLDVAADCVFVCSSVCLLVLHGVVPAWFLALVIYKFAEFVATSHAFKAKNPGQEKLFVFDSAGRAASVLFYLLPGLCCIVLLVPRILHQEILFFACTGIAVLSVYSSVKRMGGLAKSCNNNYHS